MSGKILMILLLLGAFACTITSARKLVMEKGTTTNAGELDMAFYHHFPGYKGGLGGGSGWFRGGPGTGLGGGGAAFGSGSGGFGRGAGAGSGSAGAANGGGLGSGLEGGGGGGGGGGVPGGSLKPRLTTALP